jgi:hypothetical protein
MTGCIWRTAPTRKLLLSKEEGWVGKIVETICQEVSDLPWTKTILEEREGYSRDPQRAPMETFIAEVTLEVTDYDIDVTGMDPVDIAELAQEIAASCTIYVWHDELTGYLRPQIWSRVEECSDKRTYLTLRVEKGVSDE